MKVKRAIAQAAALVLLGTVAGLVHNGFSANGINPFRKLDGVPVYDNGEKPLGKTDPEDHDGICYVSFEEFREIVDAGYPVLDSRTSDEYESGHVPGAMLCDYFEMGRHFEMVLPRLSPEEMIGIYCSGPRCDDSEMLARELYNMGYTRLCVFRGGMAEWEEAGLTLEHGPEKAWE